MSPFGTSLHSWNVLDVPWPAGELADHIVEHGVRVPHTRIDPLNVCGRASTRPDGKPSGFSCDRILGHLGRCHATTQVHGRVYVIAVWSSPDRHHKAAPTW